MLTIWEVDLLDNYNRGLKAYPPSKEVTSALTSSSLDEDTHGSIDKPEKQVTNKQQPSSNDDFRFFRKLES